MQTGPSACVDIIAEAIGSPSGSPESQALLQMARALRSGLSRAGIAARVSGDIGGEEFPTGSRRLVLALRTGSYPAAPGRLCVLHPFVPRRESEAFAKLVSRHLSAATGNPWPPVLLWGALAVTRDSNGSAPAPAVAVYLGPDAGLLGTGVETAKTALVAAVLEAVGAPAKVAGEGRAEPAAVSADAGPAAVARPTGPAAGAAPTAPVATDEPATPAPPVEAPDERESAAPDAAGAAPTEAAPTASAETGDTARLPAVEAGGDALHLPAPVSEVAPSPVELGGSHPAEAGGAHEIARVESEAPAVAPEELPIPPATEAERPLLAGPTAPGQEPSERGDQPTDPEPVEATPRTEGSAAEVAPDAPVPVGNGHPAVPAEPPPAEEAKPAAQTPRERPVPAGASVLHQQAGARSGRAATVEGAVALPPVQPAQDWSAAAPGTVGDGRPAGIPFRQIPPVGGQGDVFLPAPTQAWPPQPEKAPDPLVQPSDPPAQALPDPAPMAPPAPEPARVHGRTRSATTTEGGTRKGRSGGKRQSAVVTGRDQTRDQTRTLEHREPRVRPPKPAPEAPAAAPGGDAAADAAGAPTASGDDGTG